MRPPAAQLAPRDPYRGVVGGARRAARFLPRDVRWKEMNGEQDGFARPEGRAAGGDPGIGGAVGPVAEAWPLGGAWRGGRGGGRCGSGVADRGVLPGGL